MQDKQCREIKFKAYDKEKNCMVSIEAANFIDMAIRFDGTVWCHDSYFKIHSDNFVLVQYTGLKNKNNEELYHYDITQNKNGIIRYIDEYCGAWWLMFPDGSNDKPLYGSHLMQEIIGNKFKNPELLGE